MNIKNLSLVIAMAATILLSSCGMIKKSLANLPHRMIQKRVKKRMVKNLHLT